MEMRVGTTPAYIRSGPTIAVTLANHIHLGSPLFRVGCPGACLSSLQTIASTHTPMPSPVIYQNLHSHPTTSLKQHIYELHNTAFIRHGQPVRRWLPQRQRQRLRQLWTTNPGGARRGPGTTRRGARCTTRAAGGNGSARRTGRTGRTRGTRRTRRTRSNGCTANTTSATTATTPAGRLRPVRRRLQQQQHKWRQRIHKLVVPRRRP